MLTNFHTHTNYCHGKHSAEEMVIEAINKGFSSIGITSHSPYPNDPWWAINNADVSSYIEDVLEVKEKYKDKIKVYLGFEVDYIKGLGNREEFKKQSDYIIASNHRIYHNNEYLYVAKTDEVKKIRDEMFNGNIKELVEFYYMSTIDMIEIMKPDIIGHLDLIKLSNVGEMIFDTDSAWYKEILEIVLKKIADSGAIMEVNTVSTYKKGIAEMYPSNWILSKALEQSIPITINSDAHDKADLTSGFPEAEKTLKEIGYRFKRVLINGEWVDVEI